MGNWPTKKRAASRTDLISTSLARISNSALLVELSSRKRPLRLSCGLTRFMFSSATLVLPSAIWNSPSMLLALKGKLLFSSRTESSGIEPPNCAFKYSWPSALKSISRLIVESEIRSLEVGRK